MLYIELARRRRRWSQDQLAQLTRISQAFISFIEIGRGVPTHDQLQRLAVALDLPPELLLKPVVLPGDKPQTTEGPREPVLRGPREAEAK